jgi:hypothetical protein
MQWQEIRQKYPRKWLLIEATKAHTTEHNHRIVEQMAIINEFSGFYEAMKTYKKLHRTNPEREMYVVHTDRETIDIKERSWLGVRGIQ